MCKHHTFAHDDLHDTLCEAMQNVTVELLLSVQEFHELFCDLAELVEEQVRTYYFSVGTLKVYNPTICMKSLLTPHNIENL